MTKPTELRNLPEVTQAGSSSKPFASTEQIQQNEMSSVELGDQSQPSERITEALQQWNFPQINIWRFFAAILGFVVMGMNDAAYGALIPYLETYYDLTYTVVSLIFLAPFVGYSCAALLNNAIHMHFGQRGVAVIAPSAKLLAFVVACVHPPYPVLPFAFMVSGFGNGLEDGAWNAWIGNMSNANELLGLLHGAYGLGATISPLIATSMITKANLQWFEFYYIMVAMAVLELSLAIPAFWSSDGPAHRLAHPHSSNTGNSRTRETLTNKISWICAVFLLGYVGVEVSLGGWLVTFMLRVRHGTPFASGMTVTGFWLGITVGRVTLGFTTPRIGEKLAIAIYLLLSMGLELLFWLVPSFVTSAIMAGFLGFFLGPLFPAAVVVATKLLPHHLHVSAIGFAAAFGGGGAALFPFIVGAIASAKGVQVLQPVVLALLVAILGLWCALPGGFRKRALGMPLEDCPEGSNGESQWIEKSIDKLRKRTGFT